jgi:hypothetical protein
MEGDGGVDERTETAIAGVDFLDGGHGVRHDWW